MFRPFPWSRIVGPAVVAAAVVPPKAVQRMAVEPTTVLRVAERRVVADGVITLVLRHPTGAPLPAWEPGAHVDLLLPSGLVRQYSLCGDPGDRTGYRVGVLREVGSRGGSRWLHDQLREGSALGVAGPRNSFALAARPRYVFVAGGIGITPILTMIAAADRAGADWRLLYGGRNRASMAFTDELARYGDRVELRPQDESGLLPLRAWLDEPRGDTAVYCCGPGPLLDAVEDETVLWPVDAVHVERFTPRVLPPPVRDDPFVVELARSGRTVTVERDTSVLEALEAAGVSVLSSCRRGTCGTCGTGVLDGVPEHRDAILSPSRRGATDTMYVCVSRSRTGRLVLDR